jgi:hypothetical protein
MTVLTNGRGSVLSAYLPKPRETAQVPTAAVPARERVHVGAWLRRHARQVKDAAVATVAFGCCDVAAFTWQHWAGFVAVGVSLLLIDHSIDRGGGGDERAA